MMVLYTRSGRMSVHCCVSTLSAGCGAIPETLLKETQGAIYFLYDGVDLVGPFEVIRKMDS